MSTPYGNDPVNNPQGYPKPENPENPPSVENSQRESQSAPNWQAQEALAPSHDESAPATPEGGVVHEVGPFASQNTEAPQAPEAAQESSEAAPATSEDVPSYGSTYQPAHYGNAAKAAPAAPSYGASAQSEQAQPEKVEAAQGEPAGVEPEQPREEST
ncbi:MAG: hypothetical protein E7A88_04790, partial [Dermabacter sp.]|nr:hypothetical protein [Dermabacter sp.]